MCDTSAPLLFFSFLFWLWYLRVRIACRIRASSTSIGFFLSVSTAEACDHGQLEAVAGGACGQQGPYECRSCDYRSWHLRYGMELQKRGLEASILIVVLRNVHGHRPYQAEQVPQLHYRREE
jgi:hypothetical protein